MLCEDVLGSLKVFSDCTITDEGARVSTHCLYPSFDPVKVFVASIGGSYKVHDGAGAMRSAWDHGREPSWIRRFLTQQAAAYHLEVTEDALVGDAPDQEWLPSTILAVANASASAASLAVTRIASASEDDIKQRMHEALIKTVPVRTIGQDVEIAGASGKKHVFDFGVRIPDHRWLLIDSISPHHVSIASKYVAFSDTRENQESIAVRFAVYDRPLLEDDVLLIQTVADLVPVTALSRGVKREMVLQ